MALADQRNEVPNERQPLLRNGDEAENGTSVNGEVNEIGDSTPLPNTPSTGRIFLILGSIWIGVFFSALGERQTICELPDIYKH